MPQLNEFSWSILLSKFMIIFLYFFMLISFLRLCSMKRFSNLDLLAFKCF